MTVLLSGQSYEASLWTIDGFGQLSLRLDALSAIFLCATGIVYFPVSFFARDFIARHLNHDYPAHRYGILYFALMASVVLILVANDALLFLISWECMSILCFLLINYEVERQSDKRAGYVMLAISEAGFLAVVVAFLLLGRTASNLSFPALSAAGTALSSTGLWGVFLLGFFGFGVKAGLVPVNLWLPRSYTAAPSVFIPVFAGVTLNLGFYGILRLDADLVHTSIGTGVLALIVGSITALVGILYATTENDMKTMLGHSSIENAGIVVAGAGAFMIYRASGHPVAAAIALSASLYHMLNHSIYKTLLFQGAAYVEAETGTRDMDQLGGLSRLLPGLSIVFLVGCLAISAVPPFNGFVSEWLTLQALLRSAILPSTSIRIVFALCGATLALTAALAVTCFVKAYAMNFLGPRRGTWQLQRNEYGGARFGPAFLAVVCLLLGTMPTYVLPLLNRAVEPFAGASITDSLIPPFFTATAENGQLPPAFLQDFHNLGAQSGKGVLPGKGLVVLLRGQEQNPVVFAMSPAYSLVALAILVLLAWFFVTRLTRKRSVARRTLWAGGIPRLLPQMTYTATGFSNPVRVVFQAIFQPNITEDTRQTVAVHFRTAIHRQREETHVVDRIFLQPVGASVRWIADFLARMHHGRLNAYVTYVLAFLLFVLFLYRVT
ncbi:MAG: proton-conducting transporter membrane subunit [Terriglobia bacterium]|nr:proton-conducting transporter membrane subunit [Terriglobia bacterium]